MEKMRKRRLETIGFFKSTAEEEILRNGGWQNQKVYEPDLGDIEMHNIFDKSTTDRQD